MIRSLLVVFALCPAFVFAQDHAQHQHGVTEDAPQARPAIEAVNVDMQEIQAAMGMMHEESITGLLLADRLEFAKDGSTEQMQWEAQAWIGRDFNKLWLKTEGEYDTNEDELEELEVQLLYSRAVHPFWDVQAGVRHDEGSAAATDYAVLGLMGLAPYWFEIDAAAFVSEHGELSARVEVEYDLRFTQRLILQPRFELNYSFSEDRVRDVWQGVNDASLGLRLRYEFAREFATYLGVQWWHAFGQKGDDLARGFKASSEARVVAGLRIWY